MILKAYATWVVAAVAAVIVCLYGVADRDIVGETLRVSSVGLMAMIITGCAALARELFRRPGWGRPEEWLAFGKSFFALCLILSGVQSLFYRLSDRPKWVIDLPTSDIWVIGAVVYGVICISVPGFFGERVKRRTKITLALFWIAIALLVGFLAIARPDFRPVSDWIQAHWIESKK